MDDSEAAKIEKARLIEKLYNVYHLMRSELSESIMISNTEINNLKGRLRDMQKRRLCIPETAACSSSYGCTYQLTDALEVRLLS